MIVIIVITSKENQLELLQEADVSQALARPAK